MDRNKIVETMARGIRPGAFEEGLTEFGALCIGHNRADAMSMAERAFSALEAAGLVVVPREVNAAMLEKAESQYVSSYTGTPTAAPCDIWNAMISAALGEKGSDNA